MTSSPLSMAAKITLQQFAALPLCYAAGALVSTGTYHAFMPVDPSPGKSVEIPTAQQIAPDSADRFDITLGLPAKLQSQNIFVYRIHIGLRYNQSDVPADAGTAVMALPIAPYSSYFWTKQFAVHPTIIPSVTGGSSPGTTGGLCGLMRRHRDPGEGEMVGLDILICTGRGGLPVAGLHARLR